MKTKVYTTITGLILLIAGNLMAQNSASLPNMSINSDSYKTAVGLRAGETSGLTFKKFKDQSTAYEAILGVWGNGFSATLLLEKHASAFDVKGLNWYYGVGGHVAVQSGKRIFYNDYGRRSHYRDGSLGLGVDGVVGLEYKVAKAPLALSLDLKPYVEIVTKGQMWMSLDPGLGLKVTF